MNDKQTFQKPWQINILKIHTVVDKVFNIITYPFRVFLDSNTAQFQSDLNKPVLKSVK